MANSHGDTNRETIIVKKKTKLADDVAQARRIFKNSVAANGNGDSQVAEDIAQEVAVAKAEARSAADKAQQMHGKLLKLQSKKIMHLSPLVDDMTHDNWDPKINANVKAESDKLRVTGAKVTEAKSANQKTTQRLIKGALHDSPGVGDGDSQ